MFKIALCKFVQNIIYCSIQTRRASMGRPKCEFMKFRKKWKNEYARVELNIQIGMFMYLIPSSFNTERMLKVLICSYIKLF